MKITKIQLIISFILVVATALLCIATWKLAGTTEGYLKETAKMRDIMNQEFNMKSRPIVGLDTIKPIIGIVEKEMIGKNVVWNKEKQKYFCESTPVTITGAKFDIKIKNFSSEPATKLGIDTELWIDNTIMPRTISEELGNIIMPSQTLRNSPTLGRDYLLNALKNEKEIMLKIKIKYSDASEIEDIFEYYAEALFNGTTFAIKKSYFKDKRQ